MAVIFGFFFYPNIDLKLSLDYRWVVIFTSGWQILYLITIIVSDLNGLYIYNIWFVFLFIQKKHHILKAVHPSPLSAHRGFLGCKHFSQCNKLLEKDGKTAIDWTRLPHQWADVYTKCMILNWWLYQRMYTCIKEPMNLGQESRSLRKWVSNLQNIFVS